MDQLAVLVAVNLAVAILEAIVALFTALGFGYTVAAGLLAALVTPGAWFTILSAEIAFFL